MNYKILYKVDGNDVVISIAGLDSTIQLSTYLTSINFFKNMRDFYNGNATVFEIIDVVSFDDLNDRISTGDMVDFNYYACIEDTVKTSQSKPKNVLSSVIDSPGNAMMSLEDIISEITTGVGQKTNWKFNILTIEISKEVQ